MAAALRVQPHPAAVNERAPITQDEQDHLRLLLGAPLDRNEPQQEDAADVIEELRAFDALVRDPLANVQEWLRNYEETSAVLIACAEDVFAIPASSASVERLFSVSGNVLSDLRLSLSDSLSCAIMFLHFNRRWFWPWKSQGGVEMKPIVDILKDHHRNITEK